MLSMCNAGQESGGLAGVDLVMIFRPDKI